MGGKGWPDSESTAVTKYMLTLWLQMEFLQKVGFENPYTDLTNAQKRIAEDAVDGFEYLVLYTPE